MRERPRNYIFMDGLSDSSLLVVLKLRVGSSFERHITLKFKDSDFRTISFFVFFYNISACMLIT